MELPCISGEPALVYSLVPERPLVKYRGEQKVADQFGPDSISWLVVLGLTAL